MTSQLRAVVFAPFWTHPAHVGRLRVERFVRWLSDAGWHVVLVGASGTDSVRPVTWGTEILVRDRFMQRGASGLLRAGSASGRAGRLRRLVHYLAVYPDPDVFWALSAATHPQVLEHARGAAWVLGSSPPESVHVGARVLARRIGARLLVDMRDGWLDEPLKPWLQKPGLRRWIEAWMERGILSAADGILVTSPVWKESLGARYPRGESKIDVLVNVCPLTPESEGNQDALKDAAAPVSLLYGGRLVASHSTRSAALLLEPFLQLGSTVRQRVALDFHFVGTFTDEDSKIMDRYGSSFKDFGWTVQREPSVERPVLAQRMKEAGGLLLLSASMAAVPAKFVEYLSAGRPILAVCPAGSALWRLTEAVSHVHRIGTVPGPSANDVLRDFLADCRDRTARRSIPPAFTEVAARALFMQVIQRPPRGPR